MGGGGKGGKGRRRSASPRVVLGGQGGEGKGRREEARSCSMADLCEEDKGKIARLLKQVLTLNPKPQSTKP